MKKILNSKKRGALNMVPFSHIALKIVAEMLCTVFAGLNHRVTLDFVLLFCNATMLALQ